MVEERDYVPHPLPILFVGVFVLAVGFGINRYLSGSITGYSGARSVPDPARDHHGLPAPSTGAGIGRRGYENGQSSDSNAVRGLVRPFGGGGKSK